MSRVSRSETALAALRAQVRAVILKHGITIAPDGPTLDRIDDVIAALADRRSPMLRQETKRIFSRISDRDVEIAVSNHDGDTMAAYGDAGYFVGLCVGLELAALTCRGELPRTKVGRR